MRSVLGPLQLRACLLLAALQLQCRTAAATQRFDSFTELDRGSKSMFRTEMKALKKWLKTSRHELKSTGGRTYGEKGIALMKEFRAKKDAIKNSALEWSRGRLNEVRVANVKNPDGNAMILLEVDALTKPHTGIESMCGGFTAIGRVLFFKC